MIPVEKGLAIRDYGWEVIATKLLWKAQFPYQHVIAIFPISYCMTASLNRKKFNIAYTYAPTTHAPIDTIAPWLFLVLTASVLYLV